MITPKLEELILCGKAFFKTAVVGGSKTTINIDNDRFIIITDITFLPYCNFFDIDARNNANANTQISIYGEKGFNHYIFANQRLYGDAYFDSNAATEFTVARPMPLASQTIHCYLLHTTQVGFSFILSGTNFGPTSTLSIASFDNPAYEPPLDYGKDGMPSAINIDSDITNTLGLLNQVVNRATGLGVGSAVSQQVQYPATGVTKPIVGGNSQYPIANVNYVEILGQPNNIGF